MSRAPTGGSDPNAERRAEELRRRAEQIEEQADDDPRAAHRQKRRQEREEYHRARQREEREREQYFRNQWVRSLCADCLSRLTEYGQEREVYKDNRQLRACSCTEHGPSGDFGVDEWRAKAQEERQRRSGQREQRRQRQQSGGILSQLLG